MSEPETEVEDAADVLALVLGAALAPTSNNIFAQTTEQQHDAIDSFAVLCLEAGIDREGTARRIAPFTSKHTR